MTSDWTQSNSASFLGSSVSFVHWLVGLITCYKWASGRAHVLEFLTELLCVTFDNYINWWRADALRQQRGCWLHNTQTQLHIPENIPVFQPPLSAEGTDPAHISQGCLELGWPHADAMMAWRCLSSERKWARHICKTFRFSATRP